jgi:hypothetical protein
LASFSDRRFALVALSLTTYFVAAPSRLAVLASIVRRDHSESSNSFEIVEASNSPMPDTNEHLPPGLPPSTTL